MNNIAIIGSAGAIGHAFTEQLSAQYPDATLWTFSRHEAMQIAPHIFHHVIDYTRESSIELAALIATKEQSLDMVIVATGMLHDEKIMPEKSLRDLSTEKFLRLFEANTILPALIAKHFIPKLNKESRTVFAAMSARIGSISDNQLGGWYAYRASKAALNMIIKNAAIETARQNKQAIIVGLHPGTVDSNLSKPFHESLKQGKLFTADFSVSKLLEVLKNLTPDSSGKCFAWDGKEILP